MCVRNTARRCRGASGRALSTGFSDWRCAEQDDARGQAKSRGAAVRPSRLLLAVGIVLVGLCAAWPFRRPARPVAVMRERPAPLSLTLRRPDAPLELAPRIDVSPAVGLAEENRGQEPTAFAQASTD